MSELTDATTDGDEPSAVVVDGAILPEFSRALRAALTTRGVSLDALRSVLEERGSKVSRATLSYWRSGRSLPDRGGSILALAHVEEALRLPPGFLTSKVSPRGPGSLVASGLPNNYVPGSGPQAVDEDSEATDQQMIESGLAELGLSWDDGLRRVSYHDRLEVRADRTDGPHDVRTIFVAERAGVDRFPIWYSHSDCEALPFVVGLSNCRLGRALEFPEKTAVAAEMLLDHALARGESMIVEHRLESIGQTAPAEAMMRRVDGHIREIVMEVRFPQSQVPARAVAHRVIDGKAVTDPVALVGSSLHLLDIDPAPGVYGLEWSW